jgi:hypothetical protein
MPQDTEPEHDPQVDHREGGARRSPPGKNDWQTGNPEKNWYHPRGEGEAEAFAVRMVLRYRRELDPWLHFPNGSCHRFGPEEKPMPIGALLLLWERWDFMTGRCARCGETIYGYTFWGEWHQYGITGCCIGCGITYCRSLSGLERVNSFVSKHLDDTPFRLACCTGMAAPRWDIFLESIRPQLAAEQATLRALKTQKTKEELERQRSNRRFRKTATWVNNLDPLFGISHENIAARLDRSNWKTKAIVRVDEAGALYMFLEKRRDNEDEPYLYYLSTHTFPPRHQSPYREPFASLKAALAFINGEDGGALARETRLAFSSEYPTEDSGWKVTVGLL